MISVVGVDPGLVDTGVVRMMFAPLSHQIQVSHLVVKGADVDQVVAWVHAGEPPVATRFVEGYKARSHFAEDPKMQEAVRDFRVGLHAKVLLNTGVKKVVKQPLMELLGVWKFSTVTHHQDLRSAARIALLGMLKSEQLNRVLTDVVKAHLQGEDWAVLTL